MKTRAGVVGYVIIMILLTVTAFFSLNLFLMEKTAHDKVDIRSFPYTIGEWKAKDLRITEDEYKILETRNLVSREYTNPSGERIYLFIIYSETNRSVFHPPEVCMIGSGVTIADKRPERVDYGKGYFSVNKLYAEKGETRELVLYCYKAGNFYTESYYLQQVYLALHQVLSRRASGATVRVSMPLAGDEKTRLTALKEFLAKTAAIVDSMSK